MPRKVTEYLEHAAECRRLARVVDRSEHRDILNHMAETWDKLARQRSVILPHPQISPLDSLWPQNK